MRFNSDLIKEKTNVIEKLVFQLREDIISDKLTGDMLRDLKETVEKMITSDF